MDIDTSQLRQHLPEYLARVRQGERIRVVSRGRVVAELVPPSSEAAAERLDLGARSGDDATEPLFSQAGSAPR